MHCPNDGAEIVLIAGQEKGRCPVCRLIVSAKTGRPVGTQRVQMRCP